jgi:DNA polymerase-3 subunit beta
LARTSILSNEKYRGVRLAFEEGVLRLQAHNPEQEEAEEEIELDYKGEPVAIGFNVAYLSDVLGAVEGTEIEVRFSDAGSSSVWRGVGAGDETYVVMPMRL